ncbi:MAG: TrmB family transcriptional regulator [Candidatus Aenigmarchaeota archaeon]|nr:TrmB family transcriptional regulator [Candidatus Aenigmarchaeota archaeon]
MLASQKVMDALKAIGLNLYERKLWVALLAKGTATAGELSEMTGVPRSRTYDVLQSLADKGFVVVQTSKPLRYVAIPPEEALEKAKAKIREKMEEMVQRIDRLKQSDIMEELNNLFEKGLQLVTPEEMTGALRGKYSVMQQLDTMIKNAKKSINIITTPEGLNELFMNHFEALKKAKERGVEIKIATVPTDAATEAIKALAGTADIRAVPRDRIPISGRVFVVDGQQFIFGLTEKVHATQDMAIWSKSPHAASGVIQPLFELLWQHAEPLDVTGTKAK